MQRKVLKTSTDICQSRSIKDEYETISLCVCVLIIHRENKIKSRDFIIKYHKKFLGINVAKIWKNFILQKLNNRNQTNYKMLR